MSIVGIYLAPLIHYPMVTIDVQDGDGKKVILHFVEDGERDDNTESGRGA